MNPSPEIERVQEAFAQEAQALDVTYWQDHDISNDDDVKGLYAAKQAVWERYAALYPEWAAWSRELARHAVG